MNIDYGLERRRIAALSLPFLMNRVIASIRTYISDAPLRGMMPFPRIRQEELIYLLQNLLSQRLIDHSLYLSTLPLPSSSYLSSSTTPAIDYNLPLPTLIRSALLRSSIGHLYELHPLFTKLLNLSIKSPSITSAYIPYRNLSSGYSVGGLPDGFVRRKIGQPSELGEQNLNDPMQVVKERNDVVALVIACLDLVGIEVGSGGL